MKLYDSIDVNALPPDGDAYLGYTDGKWPNYRDIQARFPGKPVYGLSAIPRDGITVSSGFDVERYDWSPNQLPGALDRWQPINPADTLPIIYVSRAAWPTAAQYVGPRVVRWLIADWTHQEHLLPGAWGVQWESYPGYDISVIVDSGVSHPMTNPAINPPIPIVGRIVDTYNHSGGGARVLTDAGYVYDFGCPHISPGGPHEMADDAGWKAGGRVAARFDNASDSGYTIVDTAGEPYRFAQ